MTEEQKTPATPAEVEAAMESIARKAYDAGHAAGASQAIPPEFPNKLIHQEPGGEAGHLAYENELRALVFDLRGRGIRNVKGHPDVAELRARHGR